MSEILNEGLGGLKGELISVLRRIFSHEVRAANARLRLKEEAKKMTPEMKKKVLRVIADAEREISRANSKKAKLVGSINRELKNHSGESNSHFWSTILPLWGGLALDIGAAVGGLGGAAIAYVSARKAQGHAHDAKMASNKNKHVAESLLDEDEDLFEEVLDEARKGWVQGMTPHSASDNNNIGTLKDHERNVNMTTDKAVTESQFISEELFLTELFGSKKRKAAKLAAFEAKRQAQVAISKAAVRKDNLKKAGKAGAVVAAGIGVAAGAAALAKKHAEKKKAMNESVDDILIEGEIAEIESFLYENVDFLDEDENFEAYFEEGMQSAVQKMILKLKQRLAKNPEEAAAIKKRIQALEKKVVSPLRRSQFGAQQGVSRGSAVRGGSLA